MYEYIGLDLIHGLLRSCLVSSCLPVSTLSFLNKRCLTKMNIQGCICGCQRLEDLIFACMAAESRSGLLFVLHFRQKFNIFVFSFFLVYNNLGPIRFIFQ